MVENEEDVGDVVSRIEALRVGLSACATLGVRELLRDPHLTSCVASSCTGIRYWSSLSQNSSFTSSSSALHTSCWHRDRMCHECTQHSLWSALWVYLAHSCILHVAAARAGKWFPLFRGRGAMTGSDELRALSDHIAQLASLSEEVNANCVALHGANFSSPLAATTISATTVQYGSTHTRDTVPDKPRAPMTDSTPLKECASTQPTTTRTHAQPSGFRCWPRQQGKNAEASAQRFSTRHHIDTRSDLLQHTNTSSVNPRTVKTLSWLLFFWSKVWFGNLFNSFNKEPKGPRGV